MITILKENWYTVIGETKPCIICPECGGSLIGDSAIQGIKENGEVHNSVVCPCGFHDYVRLQGYSAPNIPRGRLKN